MAGFLAGLGSLAGGVSQGLTKEQQVAMQQLAQQLQMKQAQQTQQAQSDAGRMLMGPSQPLGGGGASPLPLPQMPGAQAPAPQSPAPGQSSQPRSVRDNNPGNLVASPWTQRQPGFAGTDGRFARFASPQAGQGAQGALLSNYGAKGPMSLRQIVARWAPRGDGNNNPDAYAATVAKAIGVHPDQPLDVHGDPNIRARVAQAMAGVESGQRGAQPQGGSAAPAQPPMQGGGGSQPQSQIMQLAQRIKAANPNASPGQVFRALAQMAPMMNNEQKQALQEQGLQLREQLATQREQMDLVLKQLSEGGLNSRQDKTIAATSKNLGISLGAKAEGQDKAIAATSKNLDTNIQAKKDLQGTKIDAATAAAEKSAAAKNQQFIADQSRKYAQFRQMLLQKGDIAGDKAREFEEKLDQSNKQFLQRNTERVKHDRATEGVAAKRTDLTAARDATLKDQGQQRIELTGKRDATLKDQGAARVQQGQTRINNQQMQNATKAGEFALQEKDREARIDQSGKRLSMLMDNAIHAQDNASRNYWLKKSDEEQKNHVALLNALANVGRSSPAGMSPEDQAAANKDINQRLAAPTSQAPAQDAPQGEQLPPEALKLLQEGHVKIFKNGQRWTLKNGKPVRVQ